MSIKPSSWILKPVTRRSEVQILGKFVNILSNIAENLLLIKTKHHNLNNRNPIILRWPLRLWASCYQSLHTLDIWPMVKTYSQIIVKIILHKYCLCIGKNLSTEARLTVVFDLEQFFTSSYFLILYSYMLIEQVIKQLRLVEHLHFVYRQFKSSDDGSQNTCPYAHTFFAVDIF